MVPVEGRNVRINTMFSTMLGVLFAITNRIILQNGKIVPNIYLIHNAV